MSASSAPAPLPKARIDSIDILRGLVMVLMALDHAREFITLQTFDPLDLSKTTAVLFLTRWITHFCAPVFVFLAGAGIMLALNRGRSRTAMSRFLWTRGLWLIFLEYVVIRWSFTFNWNYSFSFTQVIAVIGASMVLMAALIHLPPSAVGLLGILLVSLHNLLDPIQSNAWWWLFLHQPGVISPAPGRIHLVAYPLLPWLGILCCGYWFGSIYKLEQADRRALVRKLGFVLTVSFIVLRATNWYGDPRPWAVQKSTIFTFLSFVNCTKYPPSLLYALMTIGPALMILSFLPDRNPRIWSPFLVFGRVPMFYYLLHVPLLHALTMLYAYGRWGRVDWLYTMPGFYASMKNLPVDFGHSLLLGYVLWIVAVALLYPVCRWFASVKQRNRSPWLSYL